MWKEAGKSLISKAISVQTIYCVPPTPEDSDVVS